VTTTKLNSLTLKGFRSFADEAKLDFPSSGLILLRGKNVDSTGVSSGSGKSSILLALSHALGYCPYPASELQSWYGRNNLEVTLELETAKGTAKLVRGTKTTLEVGETKITGAIAVDRELRQLVGIDSELLAALTYRPQQTRGLFLSKTNAQMQEFLSILLGLGTFDDAIAKTNENIKILETKLAVLDNRVFNYKSNLEDAEKIPLVFPNDPQVMGDAVRSAQEDLCAADVTHKEAHAEAIALEEELEKRCQEIMDKAVKLNATIPRNYVPVLDEEMRLDLLHGELNKRIEKAENFDKATLKGLRSFLERARAELQELKRDKEEFMKCKEQEQQLLQNKCFTCGQKLTTDKLLADLRAKMGLLWEKLIHEPAITLKEFEGNRAIEQFEPKAKKLIEARQESMRKLATLRGERTAAQNLFESEANARALKNTEAARRECDKLREQYDPRLRAAGRKSDLLGADVHDAEMKLKEYTIKFEEATRRVEEMKLQNEQIKANQKKARDAWVAAVAENDAIKTNLDAERDLVVLLKGFMTSIFDEVLQQIAFNANTMLSCIPNVQNVTIGFKSESTTAKGTIKRSITPFLRMGGEERTLRSALSGGMMAAVELAVDLAVRKVITARMGCVPGWLVLDECFEGLGTTEKESCMALLTQEAQHTLILVVDHSSEFKELFSKVIEIEFQNGRSKIVS
jgi:DNA repair exonuclease SbcCD ATPase subunit